MKGPEGIPPVKVYFDCVIAIASSRDFVVRPVPG